MDALFAAIALGLAAAIGWGFSGFFDAKAARTVHPVVASFLVNAIVAVGYAIIYFLWLHQGFSFTDTGVLYAASGGTIITIGALAYFKGLHAGPISLVSPMSSAYPLVTTVLAVVFFGAKLTGLQFAAIALIMCGVFVVTELLAVATKRKTFSKGPVLGVIAALCWGIGYVLVGQGVAHDGWQQATLVEFAAMLVAFGLSVPFVTPSSVLRPAAIYGAFCNKYVLLAGGIALAAALSFNIGLAHDSSSGAVVATMSSFYPVLTVLLASRHFNETVQKVQFAGAIASITGVILLGFS